MSPESKDVCRNRDTKKRRRCAKNKTHLLHAFLTASAPKVMCSFWGFFQTFIQHIFTKSKPESDCRYCSDEERGKSCPPGTCSPITQRMTRLMIQWALLHSNCKCNWAQVQALGRGVTGVSEIGGQEEELAKELGESRPGRENSKEERLLARGLPPRSGVKSSGSGRPG